MDRPSPRSRVPLCCSWDDDGPGFAVVDVVDDADELRDFGRVVVVVEDFDVEDFDVVVVVEDFDVDLEEVVVVEDFDAPLVVVVVDDGDVALAGFFEVVAVVGLVVGFVVGGFEVSFDRVVEVVDAFGTLASSLIPASSRAWAGAPGVAGGGGDPGGGGIRSSRRAYCMIRAKTGADT